MTALLEDPTSVVLFGILAEAVLAVVLYRTGRGALVWAMIGVLALVLAGVGLEWAVVTERERVEAVLYDAAAALEINDRDGVLAHIDPADAETRELVTSALGRVEFTGVKITHLIVENINYLTRPPTVDVQLKAYVSFEDRIGEFPYRNRTAEFTIRLHRLRDGWVIAGYTWKDDPRPY